LSPAALGRILICTKCGIEFCRVRYFHSRQCDTCTRKANNERQRNRVYFETSPDQLEELRKLAESYHSTLSETLRTVVEWGLEAACDR
jgi:hypothetical protein